PAALALGYLLCLAGCDRGSAPTPLSRGGLPPGLPGPPGVVARVGGKDVTADAVARIARAQGVDAAPALEIAVRETLFARGAEARGLAGTSDVKLAREGDLARRTLRRVLAEARATPPTEAELRDAAERKWLDVDRPEGFRTVHAVVRFAPGDDDAK